MAFCSYCGEKIEEGVKFCSGCGKAASGIPNEPTALIDDVPSGKLQMQISEQTSNTKSNGLKPFQNMSIIAIILLPLFCLSSVAILCTRYYGISGILIISLFGYMMAHSIVAIIYGAKRKIMSLPILGVIGILFYFICGFICVTFLNSLYIYTVEVLPNLSRDDVLSYLSLGGLSLGDGLFLGGLSHDGLPFFLIVLIVGAEYGTIFAIVSLKKIRNQNVAR